MWRESAIEYVDGATVYIDDRDRFARAPTSARFRTVDVDLTFVAATVPIVYGQSVADRTLEIWALRAYWDWLGESYPEEADYWILAGDFNLPPTHPVWAPLWAVVKPLITEGATTLSSKDGHYANLYDNL